MAVYDVGIVGYGPAGITAAIYAARKRLSVVLIGEIPGGEITNSGEIENWPGDGVTDGFALADKFTKHVKAHKDSVEIVQDKVATVTKEAETFSLMTSSGKTFQSKTVIYTTGRHPRMLKVPGETDFKNKGVSYCATCDAPLFPDKTVAVVGGGNTGAEAVIMLQKIAKKIYLLHLDEALKADQILIDNFVNDPKVTIITKAKTQSISGDKFVTGLTYQDLRSGKTETIALDAVFVTIGAIPNTEPVKSLVELDSFGAIVADRYGKTNVPGFFAAGDVTNIRDAQIVVAAGQGCSAALSAGDYLARGAQ